MWIVAAPRQSRDVSIWRVSLRSIALRAVVLAASVLMSSMPVAAQAPAAQAPVAQQPPPVITGVYYAEGTDAINTSTNAGLPRGARVTST